MALSAFKSTSKRGNPAKSSLSSSLRTSTSSLKENPAESNRSNSNSFSKKAPHIRRSRSVSAIARTEDPNEFLNKRDNPLFSLDNETDIELGVIDKNATGASVFGSQSDDRRGRSVSRRFSFSKSTSSSSSKETGRSLSRVDTGRRFRSVSRNPASRRNDLYLSSESEMEREGSSSTLSCYGIRSDSNLVTNDRKSADLDGTSTDLSDQVKTPQTWSSVHQLTDSTASTSSFLQIYGFEDGGSVGSLSEFEEKAVDVVSEQMKAFQVDCGNTANGIYETVRSEVRRAISDIQNDLESAILRKNSTSIATPILIDSPPPNSVNAGPVELVLDIQREYAKELEQSQERSRKLRADMIAEEHRGQELSRILKELLPDPNSSNQHRSRPGRKNSIERRKVSKRLTEEAMAYFDECISISTFDSSDFSSPEDQFLNLLGATAPVDESVSLLRGSSPSAHSPTSGLNQKKGDYGLTGISNSIEPTGDTISPNSSSKGGQKFQFSFSHASTKALTLKEEIKNYLKDCGIGKENDEIDSQFVRSRYYDVEDYSFRAQEQSFLFDRVFLKNRIESGSLLVCGGTTHLFSPMASFL